MLTEKNMYNLLKKISRKDNLNIYNFNLTLKDELPYDFYSQEYTNSNLLIVELYNKSYITKDSITFLYSNPLLVTYPVITPEGYKFMESYRKNTSIN